MQLHHHPFCPHSRFVRLVLEEYALPFEATEEQVWKRRPEFLALNPAGTTPVLVVDGTAISGATVIAEYLDETHATSVGDRRLTPVEPAARAEMRRLVSWFEDKFSDEVSEYLVEEKIFKRHRTIAEGGGPPDSAAIRAARTNIGYHLRYIGWLVRQRNSLAGERLSYADLAAAAHLSCADYLGDVPWNEDETAKNWYARIKSRPAFRPLLAETLAGLAPAASYADLDF